MYSDGDGPATLEDVFMRLTGKAFAASEVDEAGET
jgi:hypothetical protein